MPSDSEKARTVRLSSKSRVSVKTYNWYVIYDIHFLNEISQVLPGDLIVQGLNLESLADGVDIKPSCFGIHSVSDVRKAIELPMTVKCCSQVAKCWWGWDGELYRDSR